MSSPTWHLLQISDVLDREMALALAESGPVAAWKPRRVLTPFGTSALQTEQLAQNLSIREFPLMRGYARAPLSYLFRPEASIRKLLLEVTPDAADATLLCTVPYFAPLAELWPGPVIYWLSDLIAQYRSARGIDIAALDRRMCAAATLVCPNSARLRSYLIESGKCDPAKLVIVPNATRAANILPAPPSLPSELPPVLHHLPRPIAGVIGNLAGNMDWLLLEQLVERTPWLHWAFIGPASMAIPDPAQRAARRFVMEHPRTAFTGKQPYEDLGTFARTFDVAILPYKRCEPTYSGSSTRFYEHLAACRPMLATRGFEELHRKEPLLRLFDTADEGTQALEALRALNFNDGLNERRWLASRDATWQTRAASIRRALEEALNPAGEDRLPERRRA